MFPSNCSKKCLTVYFVPVLASQIAFSPVPPSGIIEGNSGSHHINVYPDNFGSVGLSTVAQYFAVIVSTCVPVEVLNTISYSSLSYLISTTVLPFPEIIAFSNTHALNPEYALA